MFQIKSNLQRIDVFSSKSRMNQKIGKHKIYFHSTVNFIACFYTFYVYGISEKKAPYFYISQCDAFLFICVFVANRLYTENCVINFLRKLDFELIFSKEFEWIIWFSQKKIDEKCKKKKKHFLWPIDTHAFR